MTKSTKKLVSKQLLSELFILPNGRTFRQNVANNRDVFEAHANQLFLTSVRSGNYARALEMVSQGVNAQEMVDTLRSRHLHKTADIIASKLDLN